VLATSTCHFCRAELGICNPPAANTKPKRVRVPEKINTDETALSGTQRYDCHDDHTSPVISKNTGELG